MLHSQKHLHHKLGYKQILQMQNTEQNTGDSIVQARTVRRHEERDNS